jgi:EAL domain-containing protein (putative c-di-GMP-specific phosphodiesterase class I)
MIERSVTVCAGDGVCARCASGPAERGKTRFPNDTWLEEAISRETLFSVFQPIVGLADKRVFAYEALLRARHPETGAMIGAGDIFAACQRLGIPHVIDRAARLTSIRCAAELEFSTTEAPQFFVNFLPNAIYDPEVCLRTTVEAIAQTDLQPSQFVFEVVETEQIPDLARLAAILNYYRKQGVRTAVDDMGAGFTSRDYISALRPDYVKIDRDALLAAESSLSARADFADLVRTAHHYGSAVIIEGVENVAQLALGRHAGADYAQGFLFARPASPPQSVDWSAF